MSFREYNGGFECESIEKKLCFIQAESIVKIVAYTASLYTVDEIRLEIETTHGINYNFSEEESGWVELIEWITRWANLHEDWLKEAYPKPFSEKITVLWQLNT